MKNILFDVLRSRIMVDRQIAEEVYLPWLESIRNGTYQGGMLRDREAFTPMAYSGFFKQGFMMGGRGPMEAMDMAPMGSVAVIPIFGEFLKYGTDCAYGAMDIAPAIYKAADLKNISSIVLDTDSGGGSESAVPPFIEAIQYARSKGKPVVGHGDMVGSAAYYILSFSDYLLADNLISSAWGSIGVYVSYMDYKEKNKKDGVEQKTIYAPQSDLKNQEYREMVDNNNPQPLIDNILEPSAARFIATVRQNRKGKIKANSDAYRGKLYEGQSIVEEGLADGFGTLYKAIEVAASMAMLRKM